jgi:single-strand DNA-binding protein
LTKGSCVIASGRLKQRTYQDRDGNNRTAIELEIDEIGPSLRYATAQVTRTSGGSGGGRPQGAVADEPWAASAPATSSDDVWSTPGANYNDETPF